MNNLKPETIEGGGGIPPEPDWSALFTDEFDLAIAHEEWGVVIREMTEAQTITLANGSAIERLIHFRVIYRRSMRQIAEEGAIIRAKRTKTPRHNPHWVVVRQADDAIRLLEGELGIAPVRRARAAKAPKKSKVARAADRYLKPVAKG